MSNKIVDISGLDRFLTNIKAYFEEIFSTKQDVIEDLSDIRINAAKGATALQEHQDISGKLDKSEAENTYAAKNDLNDLSLEVQTNERVTASVISDIYDKLENIDVTGSIDLTSYATKYELNAGLDTKQDNLVSGTNIKTINNNSILGSGNLDIISSEIGLEDTSETLENISGTDYVKYVTQSLTNAQKIQARANIGAQEKLTSGTTIKTINGESILGNGNIEIKSDDAVINVELINPTYNATAECLEYKIPSGKLCELNMYFDYSIITGNINFIGIIFENPTEINYTYDETTNISTIIGELNYSKYHFMYYNHFSTPMAFAFGDGDNGDLNINVLDIYSSSGELPTHNENCIFEMDALCCVENMVDTNNNLLQRGGSIIASSVNNAYVEQ